VSKFDGKFFVHYTEKEGLPGNNVTCILEDKRGNLWFGTEEVAYLNMMANIHPFYRKRGPDSNRVWCIFEDNRGATSGSAHGAVG
jgi:ligand-binding sensor domain-containing protein